jgi:hypothetical protein
LRERRADAVMGVDTAGDHAAAVEEHKARQIVGGLIRGGIEAVRDIARGARQYVVEPGSRRHVGARELHEFCERLATLVRRRSRSIARRGRRHHGEETRGQGIEGHIGSSTTPYPAIVVYQS